MKLSFSCCAISCCSNTHIPSQGILDAMVSQEDIGPIYDKLANVYDMWGRLTESRATNRAIELAAIKDGQNILEVAVGTGLAFYEIVQRNPHGQNRGVDLSPGMLEKAKKRLKQLAGANYSLEIGTAFDLPVRTESIDLVFNCYMFDLIPYGDMDVILTEFERVLKPGGKLILVNMTNGESAGSRLYEFIYRLSPKTIGGCRGVRMAERLKQHGFRVATREYYEQMLFPSEVILVYKPA